MIAPGIGESDAVAAGELLAWSGLVGIQVHRYRRRSDWAARAQAKVLLLFMVLLCTMIVLGIVASAVGLLTAFHPVAVLGDYAASAVLGIGMLVALFRYRLYGVDVALRRTAVYATTLAALAALYVLLVAVAGSIVSAAAAPVVGGAAVGVLALAGGLAPRRRRRRVDLLPGRREPAARRARRARPRSHGVSRAHRPRAPDTGDGVRRTDQHRDRSTARTTPEDRTQLRLQRPGQDPRGRPSRRDPPRPRGRPDLA